MTRLKIAFAALLSTAFLAMQFPFPGGHSANGGGGASPTATFAVSTASSTDGTSYTTASFSPAANDLLVVFITATATAADGSVTDSTSEETFVRFAISGKSTYADTLYVFVGNGKTTSTTSRTITFDCTGDAATGAIVTVYRVSNMLSVGASAIAQYAAQSNQTAATTPAPAFAVAANTNQPVIGVVFNATNPATVTEPSSWTEDSDNGYATPTAGQEAAHINGGFTGTTVTWGSTSASAFTDMIIAMTHQTVVICGNNGARTGVNGGNENVALGTGACIPSATSTVQSCSLAVENFVTGRHIQCAVYSDTAGAPTAGGPLCTSASTLAEQAGRYTLALSGCGTLSSGSTYYIMANADAGADYSVQATSAATHGPYQTSITYGTWPTGGTWSNDDGAGGVRYASFYLNVIQ